MSRLIMSCVLFGAGTLTGGLLIFFIFKLKSFKDGRKKEAKHIESNNFFKALSTQSDLSIYKNAIELIELERQRISADIHDDLAQSLSALFLDLDKAVEDSADTQPELKQSLENITSKLETVIETLRDIIYGMLPTDLVNNNLNEAIDLLCKRHNKTPSLYIEYTSMGEPSFLPEQHKRHFYRIIQELLSNCKKHSKASRCSVNLQWLKNELILTVIDNGVGSTKAIKANRYGIQGIYARCATMRVMPHFHFTENGLTFILNLSLNQSSG